MHFNRKIKTVIASVLMAGFSVSSFALTPGSGTWVKESNLFGLQDAQTYVPANPSPAVIGGGRALMVTLHGCGQTASGNVINKMFNWEDTAEKYGMVVVAPTVPTTSRTVSGCWDWFNANHSRSTRDEAVILKLVDAIKGRAALNIDPNQIYVTGLSSGAGLVLDLACVAPDYFAGIGAAAGPELDETSTTLGSKAHFAPADEATKCKNYAGSFASSLTTQVASISNGTSDTFVDPTQDGVDRDMFKLVYGASTSNGALDVTAWNLVQSTGETWKDGNGKTRVSYVQETGMPHAWSAGCIASGTTCKTSGSGGTYVDYSHVNYPAYVTRYFFENNLRVSRDPKPVVSSCAGSASSSTSATISGAATDNGSITSYTVVLNGATAVNDTAAGSGASFSKTYNLANGYYSGSVTAVDNIGQSSDACAIAQFLVGSAPVITSPTGLAVVGTPTTTAISLSWSAVSGATGYNVYRNGGKVTSSPITATTYTDSSLTPSTTYSYTVTAINGGESAASSPVSATTAAQPSYSQVVSATASAHYVAKRLTLNQYLQMGTKYGYINAFNLYLCGTTWTNSATCGPLQ